MFFPESYRCSIQDIQNTCKTGNKGESLHFKFVRNKTSLRLYSGRAEHFWTEGAPILTKKFGASVHEKIEN